MIKDTPIFVLELMPVLDRKLMELLKDLSYEDWFRKTIVPRWTIKDIVTHLLDGNLRTLSMLRDSHYALPDQRTNSYSDLVNYLNKMNADWVMATSRLSPIVLVDLLEKSGRDYCEFLKTLDPFDNATFPVAWAGDQQSPNWFHIAREYAEKWHHQQQIRLAVVQQEMLYRREFYHPYLETSMRVLPYHYRFMPAGEGETMRFHITGDGGGDWRMGFLNNSWQIIAKPYTSIENHTVIIPVKLPGIFTKGISKEEAKKQSLIKVKRRCVNIFSAC
ncbi:MAG: maleylpyruvate isomerase N-terminal domain-containing protein [Saprospiraceae bacterium]|nr:maleylpyruvate isomerase N-terminal domain-containing protein [Saprospiraceae bacterium]